MSKCRHCGKETNEPKIQIGIEHGPNISYFYYPSISCKTKDGEMQMMLKYLDELKQDGKKYKEFVNVLEGER